GIGRDPVLEQEEDARGQARPQTHAVAELERAADAAASGFLDDATAAERLELGAEQRRDPSRARHEIAMDDQDRGPRGCDIAAEFATPPRKRQPRVRRESGGGRNPAARARDPASATSPG